jgi:hypothetical protein
VFQFACSSHAVAFLSPLSVIALMRGVALTCVVFFLERLCLSEQPISIMQSMSIWAFAFWVRLGASDVRLEAGDCFIHLTCV